MLDVIKKSSVHELAAIAEETRDLIIKTCARNGGHIAPSLGTVELTLAMLKVFSVPEDKVIWDVGHQAYAYKILTDRKERFHTLRTLDGISGFPKIAESPYDFFGTGHGGTSISAALGLKEALRRQNRDSKVIAVIGDGAMTSGLALEAMNHAEQHGKNVITVLNDNEMFISTGVGALSSWFSRKLSGQTYSTMRNEIKSILSGLPPIFRGERIIEIIRKALETSKSLLTPGILFEGFGYQYVGPIDGHNLDLLIETFNDLKHNEEPVLLHVHTKKGKGYEPAEKNPRHFHGVGPFDLKTGIPSKISGPNFTEYLGQYLPGLFERNLELVASTAAMPDGTGLSKLQNLMPERVYDVGMSEGHAVTFAAGLAAGGTVPLVAIYSSFFQRAFDNIIHDVALQHLPVILMFDRAGIVGEDGATHHGIFDMAFLRIIPNMTVMVPRDELEMTRMLELAVTLKSPVAIRYPRGTGVGPHFQRKVQPQPLAKGELLREGKSPVLITAFGPSVYNALEAAKLLEKEGVDASVYDVKFVKPLPEDLFNLIKRKKYRAVVTVEEGVSAGGAGSAVLEELARQGIRTAVGIVAIDDFFPLHGSQKEIRHICGLDAPAIAQKVREVLL